MATKKRDPLGRKRPAARAAKPSRPPANPQQITHDASPPEAPQQRNEFPVAGIGASAGGLEAFSELLASMPADAPMALVVVQHLDPKHPSMLTELLTRTTPMRVHEVRPGTRVEPSHVYVIPRNTTMTIREGVLQLSPRPIASGPHMPIDVFLRSLAEDCGDRAIGVVLSGTATDGALGIKAIKGEGGVTFAQDPATARHDGMPRSAIASGAVDFVLSPRLIGQELTRIARHPYVREPSAPAVAPSDQRALEPIYRMLQEQSGVDFRLYRQTTIRRRIARRMLVHKVDSVHRYQRLLEDNRAEIDVLYNEVLINVTRFFRDPEAFDALQQAVRSRVGPQRSSDQPLRVWVPGCATGEEAYSIAMVLLETVQGARIPLQVFGTDVSEAAIVRARAGVYPSNIELDVSPERLRRFFSKVDGQYQIKKSLRELCIFARHNLAKDPPFSAVDVISCRNVLIYFDAAVQRRIMGTFHYALTNSGVLLLGGAETIGPLTDLFTLLDKTHRIYGKKATSTRFTPGQTTFDRAGEKPKRGHGAVHRAEESAPRVVDLQREIDRILVGRYAPAGVLVNEAYDIVQVRGHTSPYLEPASGHASLNIMKMARQGLLLELRSAIVAARKRGSPVRRERLRIKQNGGFSTVNLDVIPVRTPAGESNYLVVFENAPAAKVGKTTKPLLRPARRGAYESELKDLQQELVATKDFLQSIVEEREAANEELRSANEELQSSNEELQSTNEELETAKEELQSVNEELTTVNEELQHRNSELGQLNNDLNNLIASANIPMVIVGGDLRIRRFTPMASKAFNLLPADIGRPIAAVRGNIEIPDLEQMCAQVVETVTPATREVRDREGSWHSLRIRPYRTSDDVIDGAVVTLIDVTAVKTSLEQVAAARDYSEAIVDTVPTPLVVLDFDLRVHSANRTFYETFHVTAEETLNHRLTDIGNRQWDIDALRRALAALAEHGTAFQDFEVEHDFPSIGEHVVLLNGRLIESQPTRTILLAIEDITPRRQAERALRASEELRYRRLFETANDGILLVDAGTGQITNANPAWTTLTGRAPENLLGHRLWEIDSFENRDTMRAIVRELQERDFVRYEDMRISGPGGLMRHVELACNGYRLGGRRVIQCIARDITERVQLFERERTARAEAEAANRAKDDFLSVLSHELRTPLTAMLGWIRVLRQRALDPTKTSEALETVERNTRLLGQLIEDLLDVSRIAAGKLGIEVRPVDLGIVVRGAAETVRQSADAKGVALAVHVPDRSPTVRGDRYRLQQVVWNLLSNAVKFTPKGGRIDLHLEEIPGGARITVSDTGRGIPAHFLPRIFDRFRQAESVATRTQGGLGLGLAIVRHLVELHGGRVAVFSAGEGQGATFTIELPHGTPMPEDRETEAPGREATDGAPADARLDGLRILVVEDELDTSRMLAQSLGDRGADVIPVETAAAAAAAVDQGTIHVIVSDIGLPGEDGYELIRRVRSAQTADRVPAIALTAFAQAEDIRRAIEAGFDVHLAKPIDPAELARTILRLSQTATERGARRGNAS